MYLIKNLEKLSVAEIKDVFNEAFSDYLIPFTLTEESLSAKIKAENIELANSVGVFIDNALVGFILIGIDQVNGNQVAYNAGTGVIPTQRGNKYTEKMYSFLIPILIEKNIRNHQLEVITQNTKALQVYQKNGFTKKRELVCFKGSAFISYTKLDIFYQTVQIIEFDTNDFWDSIPAYQNSFNSISRDKDNNAIIIAIHNNEIAGYIIYNKKSARVQQFAVRKNLRRKGIGSAMFSQVQTHFGGKLVSIINIDKSDKGTISFIEKIGFVSTVEQYEMEFVFGSAE